jgi:hypothetical protein
LKICDFGLARGFQPGAVQTEQGQAGFMTECEPILLDAVPIARTGEVIWQNLHCIRYDMFADRTMVEMRS